MPYDLKKLSDGKAKDLILEYAITDSPDNFSLTTLKRDLFPSATSDELIFLLNEINNSKEELINVRIGRNEVYLLKKGHTKAFLKRGGFTKQEKDSKKTPLTLYQKIYLPIFIFFGLLSIYNRFFPSVSKSDFQELSRDFDSLNVQFDSVKKKIELLPKQNLNDSSQTKNYPDVNK